MSEAGPLGTSAVRRIGSFLGRNLFLLVIPAAIGTGLLFSPDVDNESLEEQSPLNVEVAPKDAAILGQYGSGFVDRIVVRDGGSYVEGWLAWRGVSDSIYIREPVDKAAIAGMRISRSDLPDEGRAEGFVLSASTAQPSGFQWCLMIKKNGGFFSLSGAQC
jgi:hypothetical protein